ncbi:MAG: SET domain-containing protein [Flavobacteriaceae bacterium]|nr:SET domain-containing protein [Flavobacteriaceae bacterium]
MELRNEYKPLPDFLTIKKSDIDGIGLFTTKSINKGTQLGISHLYNEFFPDNYLRLPLGGFINHHDMPNCIAKSYVEPHKHIKLFTIKDIIAGEELTVKYIINKLENPRWEFNWEISQ